MKSKFIGIYAIILTTVFLQGCISVRDVSSQSPYSEMMGKKFVLQQDCYIIRFVNQRKPLFVANSSHDHFLPQNVSADYIQKQFGRFLIVGILQKGAEFIIVGCEKEQSPIDTFIYFKATFPNSAWPETIFDVSNLTDVIKKPPEFFEDVTRPIKQ